MAAARPEDPAAAYRPISGLAVASALFGCVSALALVGPAFWVVPILGTAVAAFALRDVSREGRPKAGRLAALAGLALSIGFGTQGLTGSLVSNWIAQRRATAAVQLFVEAVRAGRLGEARSMCAPAALPPPLSDRRPAGPPGADSPTGSGVDSVDPAGHDHAGGSHAGPDQFDADIADFAAMPAIARLSECGPGQPAILTAAESDPSETPGDGAYRFVVEVPSAVERPVRIEVKVGRDAGGVGFDRWVVLGHEPLS